MVGDVDLRVPPH